MNNLEKENQWFFRWFSKIYDKGILGKWLFKIVEKTTKISKIHPKSKILDIGCGTGSLLKFLSVDKSLHLYGIDASSDMLKVAERKLEGKAILKKVSVENLNKKFKNNSFDYIFIVDAFHHLPNQEKVISDCYTILKNGGRLIITDFDFGVVGNFLFHKIEPGNSGMNRARDLEKRFRDNKFKKVRQKRIMIFSVYTDGVK